MTNSSSLCRTSRNSSVHRIPYRTNLACPRRIRWAPVHRLRSLTARRTLAASQRKGIRVPRSQVARCRGTLDNSRESIWVSEACSLTGPNTYARRLREFRTSWSSVLCAMALSCSAISPRERRVRAGTVSQRSEPFQRVGRRDADLRTARAGQRPARRVRCGIDRENEARATWQPLSDLRP